MKLEGSCQLVGWWLVLAAANLVSAQGGKSDQYVSRTTKGGVKYQELRQLINNPRNDSVTYAGLKLSNNLRAIVVHDPKAIKAAGHLQVWAGSLADPKAMPGLAHLYEHMLFSGSKKYPERKEYLNYISRYSGSPNGFTRFEETAYHFTVNPAGLSGTLDRFANSLIAPLLAEDNVGVEAKVVDGEFNNEFTSPRARLDMLQKATSDPNHPYSINFIGNVKSLYEIPRARGLNPQKLLKDFGETNYSANIMRLAVISSGNLADLVDQVVTKFTPIKDRKIKVKSLKRSPFRAQDKAVIINAVAAPGSPNFLDIQFDMPSMFRHQKTLPITVIKHLLLHSGPGSLASQAVAKLGWATNISYQNDKDTRDFSQFTLTFELTQLGLEHRDDILKLVFQALNVIKRQGVTKERVDELIRQGTISNMYGERRGESDVAESLANAMLHSDDLTTVLQGSEYPQVYDSKIIHKFLTYANPKNMRVTVMSQANAKLKNLKIEKWYGTKYRVDPLKSSLIKELEKILRSPTTKGSFKLAPLNPWIPTKFDLIPGGSKAGYPVLIAKSPSSALWHAYEDSPSPKATIKLQFSHMGCSEGGSQMLGKLKMTQSIVEGVLEELSTQVGKAGTMFYLSEEASGLSVHLYGFSQHLGAIAKEVVRQVKKLKVTPEIVKKARNSLVASQRDIDSDSLGLKINSLFNKALVGTRPAAQNKKEDDEVIDFTKISATEVSKFFHELFNKGKVTMLASGNISPKSAKTLLSQISNKASGAYSRCATTSAKPQTAIIPQGRKGFTYTYLDKDPERQNSVTSLFLDTNDISKIQEQAMSSFLGELIKPPAFNQLRGVEGLGYSVSAVQMTVGSRSGIHISVEGNKNPLKVEQRIEVFLNQYSKELKATKEADFRFQLKSFTSKAQVQYADPRERTRYYWDHITSGTNRFADHDQMTRALPRVTKSSVLDLLNRKLSNASNTRRKLSLHLVAAKMTKEYQNAKATDQTLNPGTFIKDLVPWRSQILAHQTKQKNINKQEKKPKRVKTAKK